MKYASAIISVCIAAATVLAIPPALSSLSAGHAAPAARDATDHGTEAAVWAFQPITAEMTAAIRTFKNRA